MDNLKGLTCHNCAFCIIDFCAKGYEFGIGPLKCLELHQDSGFIDDGQIRRASKKAEPVVKNPTREEIIGLLWDWGRWVGNDWVEIQKDAGSGKSIGQILVDRAKHDDPDTIYSKNRSSFYDQDAMNRIDYFVTRRESTLTSLQQKLLRIKYHERVKPRQEILKKLHRNKTWYHENHNLSIESISKEFNNIFIA